MCFLERLNGSIVAHISPVRVVLSFQITLIPSDGNEADHHIMYAYICVEAPVIVDFYTPYVVHYLFYKGTCSNTRCGNGKGSSPFTGVRNAPFTRHHVRTGPRRRINKPTRLPLDHCPITCNRRGRMDHSLQRTTRYMYRTNPKFGARLRTPLAQDCPWRAAFRKPALP